MQLAAWRGAVVSWSTELECGREIVVAGLGDAGANERASGHAAVGEIRRSIDTGRLAVPAALEQVLGFRRHAVDEDVDLLADHRLVALAADLTLDLHEPLLALRHHVLWYAVREHRRGRPGLDRVRERTRALE